MSIRINTEGKCWERSRSIPKVWFIFYMRLMAYTETIHSPSTLYSPQNFFEKWPERAKYADTESILQDTEDCLTKFFR